MSESTIALSYSRLSDFETCPLKFKAKYITKDYPDDSNNPAFVKGAQIHKQLEDFVNGLHNNASTTVGTIANSIVPMLVKLFEATGGQLFPEKQLAVNHDWQACDWFDKPSIVKYRAIIDALAFLDHRSLLVIDYKTGKVRPYEDSETSQLRLTAVMLFNLYPKIEVITCSYMFLEHKKTIKAEFHRKDLEAMQKPFDEAHAKVNAEKEFPFKKNKYCNWCEYKECPVKQK